MKICARYLGAWKEHWRKPDWRYGERLREFASLAAGVKAYIRVQIPGSTLRKLHYHIAEVQHAGADQAEVMECEEERLSLIAEGKWYPLSYRQWWNNRRSGDKAVSCCVAGIIGSSLA